MNAIGGNLPLHLPRQPIRTSTLPVFRLRRSLKNCSRNKERGGFAYKVGIRTAEQRRIAVDVVDLSEQRPANARGSDISQRSGWKEQKKRPDPGGRANCDFQAGLPVHSNRNRILFDPAVELGDGFLGVSFVARKKIGLCQTNDVLMPV